MTGRTTSPRAANDAMRTTTTAAMAVLALCCGVGLAAKLPPGFPPCHVNDAEFSSCLRRAMQTAVETLREGERSLGLPSIAPLKVDAVRLDLGQGPISLILDAKNVSVAGLDQSDVKSVELDTKNHLLTVKAFTKRMRLDFDAKTSGKILVVPVLGVGPAFFEFDDTESTHRLLTEPVEKKGKTYWKVTSYEVDINPSAMRCHFHELLKGNKAVNEQVNGVLNAEWKQFYQQIKKPAEEVFSDIFKQMAMRVFDRIPINDIYLDLGAR